MGEGFLFVGGSYDGERVRVERELECRERIFLPLRKMFHITKLFKDQECVRQAFPPEKEEYKRFRMECNEGYVEIYVFIGLSDLDVLTLLLKGYNKGGSNK